MRHFRKLIAILAVVGLSAGAQLFGQTNIPLGIPAATSRLQDKDRIAISAHRVLKASGEIAERMILERFREDFALWKTAADQNMPEALYLLGQCYVYGIEVAIDKDKAFACFRKAAESGWVPAVVQLGSCYQNGLGVAMDETEAFKCYRRAAEHGNALGEYCLGICYQNGIGVTKSAVDAA